MQYNNNYKFFFSAIVIALGSVMTSAQALDVSASRVEANPFESFKFGISAYKNGNKAQAVEALRYAAERGHTGASWKLGRMYADGDGVPENEYQSYQYFVKIIQSGTTPGSPNEAYVADALIEVASFIRSGIKSTPVNSDPTYARRLFIQAATSYGNPQAQFIVGLMTRNGEGCEKNEVQAARWFQLSSQKGHVGAQAMLGDMLFRAGKSVRGLALMTVAYQRADKNNVQWIYKMKETASAVVNEVEREKAYALADDMLLKEKY